MVLNSLKSTTFLKNHPFCLFGPATNSLALRFGRSFIRLLDSIMLVAYAVKRKGLRRYLHINNTCLENSVFQFQATKLVQNRTPEHNGSLFWLAW